MKTTLRHLSLLLSALCLSAALQAAVSASVRVDQVGYKPTESKYGMVAGGAPTGAFNVRKVSDNSSVFSGTLAASFADADSGDSIRTADFSALTTPGSYYLDVAGVGQSYNFQIDDAVFQSTYVLAVRGFYGQRCGMAVNLGNVDGVTYQHPACHVAGACNDSPASYHTSSGKTGTRDEVGGWHDAGDYGKYIVNSGISTGELLWTWEFWSDRLAGVSSNIPESGNGTPDVLNEARWNLQWMLKMQDTDGGVWHKDTSAGFGSFVLPNLDDSGTRYIVGSGTSPYKTSCSTADFAAVMAVAARLFQPYDAAFAATCLTAAQNAWTWVSANPNVTFSNPTGINTGGYGDGNTSDERLWAAAELFRSTGNATYNTYVTANTPAGTLFGTGLQQDWANVRNLALWTYYFSGQASANAALLTRIQADTLSAATTIANRTNGATNGYKVSLSGSGQYIWGSNGAVANYAILLLLADRMSPNTAYTDAALNDLHYLLGRNTFNTSYVTHVGSKPFLHPHHRPSGDPAYSAGAPWPGLLSGGPNFTGSSSGDGTTPSSPYPARCWIDAQGAYAANEIAINWQAPLVFLLAWALPVPDPNTPTPTATATPYAGSPTSTHTATATPTRTATFSFSPTASPSATATPTQTPCAGGVPTPDYFEGMEGGVLPCGWTAASTGTGRVRVMTGLGTGGTYALLMDSSVDNSYGASAVGFPVDIAGFSGVTLSFTVYNPADETNTLPATATGIPNGDGVMISEDGVNWVRLWQGATYASPTTINLDLSAAVATAGFSNLGSVWVRFIQYDNYTWNTDGYVYDNVAVTATGGPSPTPSPSRTHTPSATRSATPSPSPSATASPSPTPSATPSASPSASASPTVSATASASATASLSPSASPSPSPSWTASPAVSATDSPTPTPSWTPSPAVSPTATETVSATASSTGTATATPTASPTGTPSASPSVSPSATASPTDSPTPTHSPVASPTATPSISASVTLSPTPTPSPSETGTAVSVASPTATPSLTAAPTAAADGPLIVEEAVPVPHPVAGTAPSVLYKVRLSGNAQAIRFRVYSRALVLVSRYEAQGHWTVGWNEVRLPLTDLHPGTWFCAVDARQGGRVSLHRPPGRLVILP